MFIERHSPIARVRAAFARRGLLAALAAFALVSGAGLRSARAQLDAQGADAGAGGDASGQTGQPDTGAPSDGGATPDSQAPPVKPRVPSALETRITEAQAAAKKLVDRVSVLQGRNMLSARQAEEQRVQVDSWSTVLASFAVRAGEIVELEAKGTPEAQNQARNDETALASEVKSAELALEAIRKELTAIETATGWSLVETILRARCATAICFDNGQDKKYWLGIEPLVELPIGKSFALSNSALSDYVNNHDLRVDLAAGVRVWLFRDVVSVSVYLSKPLTDSRVRLEGSPFVYPASAIRRPYPGIALGALFDSVWIGFDREELRNGDGEDGSAVNPDFPPNEVVSSSWTLTLALQPVTAFRTAIGTAVQSSREDSK
jgi:hypothetical protein